MPHLSISSNDNALNSVIYLEGCEVLELSARLLYTLMNFEDSSRQQSRCFCVLSHALKMHLISLISSPNRMLHYLLEVKLVLNAIY